MASIAKKGRIAASQEEAVFYAAPLLNERIGAPLAEFKFHCPECGQKIQTTDDMVGHSVDCPICRKADLKSRPRPRMHPRKFPAPCAGR